MNWEKFDKGVFLINVLGIVYDPKTKKILIGKRENDPHIKYYRNSFKDVIVTNHYFGGTKKKSEVCLENGIEWMIEDMAHYANDCTEAGVKVFLIERPWNINEKLHSNVQRVKNWSEIDSILVKSFVK